MSALIQSQIDEGSKRIEKLEQRVAEVKADTASAFHNLNVTTRYASRIQSAARATPIDDAFAISMKFVIDADRAASSAGAAYAAGTVQGNIDGRREQTAEREEEERR